MNFNILYVENREDHAKDIEKAAKHSREKQSILRPLHVDWIRSPDDIALALKKEHYDVVLADVYFGEPGNEKNRLRDIIDSVGEWSKKHNPHRPIPIIAYTAAGKAALDECLALNEFLYDIWDKNTARPPYVAWRFKQLALEFARNRPDALLQRRIRKMPTKGKGDKTIKLNASWHEHVVDMTLRYDMGWTERDQVMLAGAAIHNIATTLGTFETCEKCWEVMLNWEALGRAVSRRARGHARHVINVFWLGYYLLHHPSLREWFSQTWMTLIKKRSDMEHVAERAPLEALSNTWFYAALFHDIGGCVEKHLEVSAKTKELLQTFGDFVKTGANATGPCPEDAVLTDILSEKADTLFHAFGEPLRNTLRNIWKHSVSENHPDHGVVSAVYLTDALKNKVDQLPYAREAARAMILHNLVGDPQFATPMGLSWADEPLACLLILCDQLQTWDRQRGDQALQDKDEPERAELSKLDVTTLGERPTISMVVHYLAPRHLDHAADTFRRVADTLEYILKDKPHRALARIEKPWPIGLDVDCWLNDKELKTEIRF